MALSESFQKNNIEVWILFKVFHEILCGFE